MNDIQIERLAVINDRWPVSRWNVQEDGSLKIWHDDGDISELFPDGTAFWHTVRGEPTNEEIDFPNRWNWAEDDPR